MDSPPDPPFENIACYFLKGKQTLMNLVSMLKRNSVRSRTAAAFRQSMIDCYTSAITNSAKHISARIGISDKGEYTFLIFLKYPIGELHCYLKLRNFQFPNLSIYKIYPIVTKRNIVSHYIIPKTVL